MHTEYCPQRASLCKCNCVLGRHLEHEATCGHRTVTKRHGQHSTGREKGHQVRHCKSAFLLVKVHPDGRQHDKVELLPAADDLLQAWQTVVDPLDER